MRFLLALLAFGLLSLGLSAPTVAAVNVTGDDHARAAHAAAVAATEQAASIGVQDNWARDKYAASAAKGAAPAEVAVTTPLPDPSTPWVLYAMIGVVLLIGTGALLISRHHRLEPHRPHLPHGG